MTRKTTADTPLNHQQEQFCQEYLIDLNATAAAARAGYSDPNYGRNLIAKANVETRIASLMAERSRRTEITADRVLTELAAIGFTNFTELALWDEDTLSFIPSDDLPEAARRSVKSVKSKRTTITSRDGSQQVSVEMEITQHDKLSALDKIAKHLGLYRPEEGTGRTSGLEALVQLMAARRAERRQGQE